MAEGGSGKPGKGNFSEFNAKLEKHIERLPDYAQKAQEKLQKYQKYLPNQSGDRSGSRDESTTRDETTERPEEQEKQPRTANAPLRPREVAAITDVRDKWARWNDPAAKLERRKRRTSKAVTLFMILTLLAVLWAVGGYFGITGSQEGFEGAFGGITAVVIFGVLGVRTGMRLRQLKRTEVPAPAAPRRMPSANSAARKPMERLAESEATLTELLGQLATPAHGASGAVPEVSVEDARATATEAATTLRSLAARIQSIERAKASAPAGERPALDSAVRALTEQLDDGVEGYGSLVAAAGRAVAASSSGVSPAKESLTDATDRLAGLALALRELS
ncbi:phage shock envelope stress response protein PspM [Prauserella cavernicola]|uniref:Uncharacterized protein n=1 Tax=Prauserella cavernicola TaxID=2800127 RepID=A0A934QXN7_9PSEU|nr:hypothetical protein [Prauserella cavernicola]MBK1788610.1 hypothetical protein [Prauserella cavernicola]